jgi:hypothetical protein
MSFYYKQKFVSPQSIFALVTEELKGYMDTGAVDNTLFPLWTDKCLKKLGKASYPINQAILCIDNFEAKLPEDYYAIREAWACTEFNDSFQLPNSTYTQLIEQSTRIDGQDFICVDCPDDAPPDVIQAIYKTTQKVAFSVKKQYLLSPGNIYPACPKDLYCANYGAIAENSYDIRDEKFITTFRNGVVYIQYYSNDFNLENQLIPDSYRTKEFIEAFLKQKLFEQLYNQATDETQRAIESKYIYYKGLADESYIMADTENKKEDVYRKQRATKRVQNRFKRFDII